MTLRTPLSRRKESMQLSDWLTGVEVRKALKISTCDLAHLREDGAMRADKRGNAYYYAARDVEAFRAKTLTIGAGFCRLEDAAD